MHIQYTFILDCQNPMRDYVLSKSCIFSPTLSTMHGCITYSSYSCLSACMAFFLLHNNTALILITASSPDLPSLQRSLAEKVQKNQAPETRTFFLNLNVRRAHLVEDSINEVCVAIVQTMVLTDMIVSIVSDPT